MMAQQANGHSPILSFRDFAIENAPYRMEATGVVRATNTAHGARLIVECRRITEPNPSPLRAFFVSFKSRSYVRLCEELGDNIGAWRGVFFVRVVRDGRDQKRRVEVV